MTCAQDDSVVFRLIGLRQNFFPNRGQEKRVNAQWCLFV